VNYRNDLRWHAVHRKTAGVEHRLRAVRTTDIRA
jgi:hypothetical protein